MKVIKLFASVFMVLLSAGAFAQVSSDSMTVLKRQKESLGLSSKINDRKMQLAKLENTLDKKTRDVENTAADARKAADDNADAASKLSSDPQDKGTARRARKSANAAEKSAKRARIAADDLASLRKDIDNLKSKIADDEAKLLTMTGGM